MRAETALLLRVHQSNFRVVGFTELPRLEELAAVAQRHGLPLLDDLGSGVLDRAVPGEPSARESLAAGADLVCFSGDKLLGGPQAGIVVGRADLVERLRVHPLQRAVRADKLTLAALEGTLRLYLDAPERIPVLRMLREDAGAVRARAERLAALVGGAVEETVARVGGGALPLAELPSFACAVEESLAAPLRVGDRPSSASCRDGKLLLDCRTLRGRRDRRGRGRRGAMPLTVGTAGHIDHGKTTLVEALTGKNTDRLPQERERGISIDLGYAPLALPDGTQLSVVDVPGPRALRAHDGRGRVRDRSLPARDRRERGRAAADARASRDPPAARHRARRRRADEDRSRRRGDARARARGGGGARARRAGRRGERAHRRRARRAARGARGGRRRARRASHAPTRLYVDRVFTLRGIGTVATGTLWSGSIGEGDELRAEPGGRAVRVRSVQVHDRAGRARRGGPARRARAAGHRAAASCGAATRSSRPARTRRATGSTSRSRRSPRSRRACTSTTARRASLARVVRVGDRYAQLRLAEPVVAARGDRVILRAAHDRRRRHA